MGCHIVEQGLVRYFRCIVYVCIYISLYIVYIFVSNSITTKVELRLVKPTSGIVEPVILKVIKLVCSKGGF